MQGFMQRYHGLSQHRPRVITYHYLLVPLLLSSYTSSEIFKLTLTMPQHLLTNEQKLLHNLEATRLNGIKDSINLTTFAGSDRLTRENGRD
jgi:hypothetical protein